MAYGGKLTAVAITVGNNDAYVFNANGSFDSHWFGDNCYDEKGNVVMTKKSFFF